MIGRPLDSFADPVSRVRAWDWLTAVQELSELEDAWALDRSPHAPKTPSGGQFQSIFDDGFDPTRVVVSRGTSLLGHMGKNPQFKGAALRFGHPIWDSLKARMGFGDLEPLTREGPLQSQGLIFLESSDLQRARSLGLNWPELRNAHSAVFDYLCPSGAKTPTLDRLLVLLLIYRSSSDIGDEKLQQLSRLQLRFECQAFGRRFRDEQLWTWDYLMHTRILRWWPDFSPSLAMVAQAREQLQAQEGEKRPGRGRPRKRPGESAGGKVERRWRRRALMLACRNCFEDELALSPATAIVPRNDFTAWLVASRSQIDSHVESSWAAFRDEAGNLESHGARSRDSKSAPLMVPADAQHLRDRPADPDSRIRDLFGPLDFDLINAVEYRPDSD